MPDQAEVSKYLNELRDSGETNMFGAGPYIQDHFEITRHEARMFVKTWMKNFGKGEDDVD